MTSIGATQLFHSLRSSKLSITGLNLNKNELDDNCLQSLGEFIQFCSTLEMVNIGQNKISDQGIDIVAPFLASNTTLKSFIISGNTDITDKSIQKLIEITTNSNINEMNISKTSIKDQSALVVPLIVNEMKSKVDKIELPLQ